MRYKTLSCLLLFLFVSAGLCEAQKDVRSKIRDIEATEMDGGKKYAIIVGVNDYQNNDAFGDLNYAENDAEALAEVFLSDNGGLFNVKLLTTSQEENSLKPTKNNILRTLDIVVGNTEPGDTVLFMFSGHGARDKKNGVDYIVPSDAYRNLEASAISLAYVESVLNDDDATVKLAFIDACRNNTAARATGSGLGYDFDIGQGVFFLFSTKAGQVSYEHQSLGMGVFSYALKRALTEPDLADANRDGIVSFNEIAATIPGEVKDLAFDLNLEPQIPFVSGEHTGDVALGFVEQFRDKPYEDRLKSEAEPGFSSIQDFAESFVSDIQALDAESFISRYIDLEFIQELTLNQYGESWDFDSGDGIKHYTIEEYSNAYKEFLTMFLNSYKQDEYPRGSCTAPEIRMIDCEKMFSDHFTCGKSANFGGHVEYDEYDSVVATLSEMNVDICGMFIMNCSTDDTSYSDNFLMLNQSGNWKALFLPISCSIEPDPDEEQFRAEYSLKNFSESWCVNKTSYEYFADNWALGFAVKATNSEEQLADFISEHDSFDDAIENYKKKWIEEFSEFREPECHEVIKTKILDCDDLHDQLNHGYEYGDSKYYFESSYDLWSSAIKDYEVGYCAVSIIEDENGKGPNFMVRTYSGWRIVAPIRVADIADSDMVEQDEEVMEDE